MQVVRTELELERPDVVYPGQREFEIASGVRALPLTRVIVALRDLWLESGQLDDSSAARRATMFAQRNCQGCCILEPTALQRFAALDRRYDAGRSCCTTAVGAESRAGTAELGGC